MGSDTNKTKRNELKQKKGNYSIKMKNNFTTNSN